MCKVSMPAARTAAPPPKAPMQVAGNLRMQERPDSQGGEVGPDTARGRRTLRNPMKMQQGAGVQAPQMG